MRPGLDGEAPGRDHVPLKGPPALPARPGTGSTAPTLLRRKGLCAAPSGVGVAPRGDGQGKRGSLPCSNDVESLGKHTDDVQVPPLRDVHRHHRPEPALEARSVRPAVPVVLPRPEVRLQHGLSGLGRECREEEGVLHLELEVPLETSPRMPCGAPATAAPPPARRPAARPPRAARSLLALVSVHRRVHATDAAIVRIFHTYGPRMRTGDGRAVPASISQALDGMPLTVAGDGSQTRSLCYVDDTVDGILALAASGEPGPFNIGGGEEITVRPRPPHRRPHRFRLPHPAGRTSGRRPREASARPGWPASGSAGPRAWTGPRSWSGRSAGSRGP